MSPFVRFSYQNFSCICPLFHACCLPHSPHALYHNTTWNNPAVRHNIVPNWLNSEWDLNFSCIQKLICALFFLTYYTLQSDRWAPKFRSNLPPSCNYMFCISLDEYDFCHTAAHCHLLIKRFFFLLCFE